MKAPPPNYNGMTQEHINVVYPPPSTDIPQITIQQQNNLSLGPFDQQAYCSSCKQQVQTKVKYVAGTFAWLLCFLFMLFGLFCGCCCIPFCVDSCKDAEHFCTQCNTYIGTYQRLGSKTKEPNIVIVKQI
ncbi:LITAF domain-containing protein [Meloidogyne graminicola]|uniref:LITAF domain-containing protein n=1 Tax=Meloidogyne graminicola TaxID=189291 RepID=A0A8S9ZNI6_9BILA|nr:LITAF domain-containing protein [Meloidogyne graminicola]